MKMVLRVQGIDKAMAKIQKGIAAIHSSCLKGFITAGLLVMRDSMKLCPVDTGNLRASAFMVWGKAKKALGGAFVSGEGIDRQRLEKGRKEVVAEAAGEVEEFYLNGRPNVIVGFSAFYGIFVHEDGGARHKVGQWKFLQEAVTRNYRRIIDIIKSEGKRGARGKSGGDLPHGMILGGTDQ